MKDEKIRNRPATTVPIYRQVPLALLLAPLFLRLIPCFNAFWFDEIWSWQIARIVRHPWGILTNPLAQTDNNHPLNTLWMYLAGDTSAWWIYRLPSLLAGCAMVLLILWMERKTARWTPLAAALLIGLSFPLITYSSEARGYAPMLLCAAMGFYLLRSLGSREVVLAEFRDGYVAASASEWRLGRKIFPNYLAWKSIAFAVICIVGVLFHLTFLHFLFAAVIWVLCQRQPKKLWLFAAPLLVLVAYFCIFLRHIQVGGAPDVSAIFVTASALSLLLGGPFAGAIIYLIAIAALALVIDALFWMRQQSVPEAIFFFLAIFLAPIATIFLQWFAPSHAPNIQVRYLLVPFTFSLILLCRYFGANLQRSSWRRRISMGVLALATLGNGYHLGRFLAVGRGDYRAAVEHLAANSSSSTITWSSSDPANDYRVNSILLYYQRFLPQGVSIARSSRPDWLIFNIQDSTPPIPTVQYGASIYHFDSSYPAYGLSGWTWTLYKKG